MGTAAAALFKRVYDNFSRTTSSSFGLGTTAVGNRSWTNRTGEWYANGSQAVSDSNVSATPAVATVSTGAVNMVASVSTFGPGTGVAFWWSAAGSWYAAVNTATQTPYTYGCQLGCYSCTYPSGQTQTAKCGTAQNGSFCGYTSSGGYCQNGGYGPCYGGSVCTQNPGCTGFVTGSWISGTYSANTCYFCDGNTWGYDYTTTYENGPNCSYCGAYEYGCQTGYTASYQFRLLQSVGGTVSDATGAVSLGSPPAAIGVTLFENTVTARSYTNAEMTVEASTPLTLTITPNGSNITDKVGIIKVSSPFQSSSVDNFSAQP